MERRKRVNWRDIAASRNSYAALYAACERSGYTLYPVDRPTHDITCYSLNSLSASRYLREIEESECITVVGGPHASARFADLTKIADYVVVGEGEYTLPALLSYLDGRRPTLPPGVATGDGYTPTPYSVLLGSYPPFSEMKGYLEISRGCPFGCGYCQTPRIFGRCMRHRPIDQIVTYARKFLQARFVSPNALAYGSDGRVPRFGKVEALLRHLSGEIYFGTFPSEVRPEFVTDRSLELITTYCANTRIQFGAQSGSDTVLKKLNRGHTVDDVVRAVELCRSHGLFPVVDLILGFPFESADDERLTLDLIRWIARSGRVHIHQFLPLPGTPLDGTVAHTLSADAERVLGALARSGNLTGSWCDPQIRFSRNRSNDIA
ncbi:MAG: TIGR04013 family B12-binding domain/radical SAM domain-containing protein [Methanoregulaceae archaeon]|nr:TIGR04013 family B12-binding domain/radical SAM domain-containing protein [Methanoregulaceae archaeon]